MCRGRRVELPEYDENWLARIQVPACCARFAPSLISRQRMSLPFVDLGKLERTEILQGIDIKYKVAVLGFQQASVAPMGKCLVHFRAASRNERRHFGLRDVGGDTRSLLA